MSRGSGAVGAELGEEVENGLRATLDETGCLNGRDDLRWLLAGVEWTRERRLPGEQVEVRRVTCLDGCNLGAGLKVVRRLDVPDGAVIAVRGGADAPSKSGQLLRPRDGATLERTPTRGNTRWERLASAPKRLNV